MDFLLGIITLIILIFAINKQNKIYRDYKTLKMENEKLKEENNSLKH